MKKALKPKDFTLSKRNFDSLGNFSFGVPEYIEFPGAKYDPKIGIIGFDVCVSLKRKGGWRIARKRIRKAKIPNSHRISRDEGIAFAQNALGVKISE